MSQAGYTPIQLYFSTTAAAVPVNTNLANGELAINITDEKLYFKNAAGVVKLLASNATSAPVLSFSAGTTGFTPSTATTGAVTLAGTLATTNGGTGLTAFTSGGVVYASSSSALATGSALTFDGTKFTQTASTTAAGGLAEFKNSSSASQTGNIVATNDASTAVSMRVFGSAAGTYGMLTAGSPMLYTAASELNLVADNASGVIKFGLNGSAEQMRLTSTGLGIGTSSPAARVHAYGTSGAVTIIAEGATTNAAYGRLEMRGRPAGASQSAGYIVAASTAGGQAATNIGAIDFAQEGASGNASFMAFSTHNGTTLAEKMRLNSSGNLGLGVTPSAWGSLFKAQQIGATGALWASTSTAGTWLSRNTYYNGTNFIYLATAAANAYEQDSGGAHKWYTAASGTAGNAITFTQAMTLDASGNLGIGTTSPTAIGASYGTIDIRGTNGGGINVGTTSTNTGSIYGNASGITIQANGATNTFFYTNGTERFRIAADGSWGLAGSNYGTSGQVLTSGGSGAAPTWTTVGGGSAATPTALGTVYGLTNSTSPNNVMLGYNAGVSTTGTNNVVVGVQSLFSNVAGSNNTSVGYQAGYTTNGGNQNVFVGRQAGYAVTGGQNTVIGDVALNVGNASGNANTVVGGSAGQNISGGLNTAIGHNSMRYQGSGSSNTALGYGTLGLGSGPTVYNFSNTTAIGKDALYSNTASDNTAVGYFAAYANTTGTTNVTVGAVAMRFNTTGSNNTVVGYQALYTNTTGSNDVAIGYQALYSANPAVSGYTGSNVAIGYRALYSAGSVAGNSTGGCVAIGSGAGYSVASAGNGAVNTFIGQNSGYNTSSGYGNTFVGAQAGSGNTSGYNNVCIGYNSGRQSVGLGGANLVAVGVSAGSTNSGNDNTFVGVAAGSSNAGGTTNAYFGTYAAQSNSGSNNVALGSSSMYLSTSASSNVVIGYQAANNMTTATGNTLVGTQAGYDTVPITTGSSNTIIGAYCRPSIATATNQIVLGYNVTGQADSNVTIGTLSGKIYNAFTSNATWTQTSDGRLKTNVQDDSLGLSFINRLRPVKFNWKPSNEVDPSLPQYNETNLRNTSTVIHGLIAQEVKAALDAEGVSTFAGWDVGSDGVQAISREMFISPLIKAIQELTTQVDTLKSEIATLKGA